MAILPSPLGSNAKPMRGAGLKRCPARQPAFEEDPTLTVGNADPGTKGRVPPAPPHWTKPFTGLPVPDPMFSHPPPLKPGSLAAPKALGLKLKACLYRSRYVPNILTPNPNFRVTRLS